MKTKTRKILKILTLALSVVAILAVMVLPAFANVVDGVWDEPVGVVEMSPVSAFDGVQDVIVDMDGWYEIEFQDVSEIYGSLIQYNNKTMLYVVKQGDDYFLGNHNLQLNNGTLVAYYDSYALFSSSNIDKSSFRLFVSDYPGRLLVNTLNGKSFKVYNVLSPKPSTTENLTNVWSGIFNWVVSALAIVTGAFWTGTELTLLGTISIVALTIGLVFLLVSVLEKFLDLRG